jgi:hypothetical protein
MSVSEDSAQAIYAAIERLKRWAPAHTDVLRSGDLTDTNLALEAGVGRATLYRAVVALSEWNKYLADVENDIVEAQAPQARVRQLERKIRTLRTAHASEVADLRALSDSLAQRVQVLTIELHQPRAARGDATVHPISRGR